MDITKIKDTIDDCIDESQKDFISTKANLMIRNDIDYPEPQYLYDFKGVKTIPRGNVVSISAKWKSGKTFLCSIFAAVFLGSVEFDGFKTLYNTGKVLFFDTEQDISDTARIQKCISTLIDESQQDRLEIYNMRALDIYNEEKMSRYDFIEAAIKHCDDPVLIIVDGIADLLYNFNDVTESTAMVNRFAALASEYNCVIMTVMHQNKSQENKTMKGHLGTMLYQKSSDVFSVERCGDFFICSHPVSRHSNIQNLYFHIVEGVPLNFDAPDNPTTIDTEKLTKTQMDEIFHNYECDVLTGKAMIYEIRKMYKCSMSKAYVILSKTLSDSDGKLVKTTRNKYRYLDY